MKVKSKQRKRKRRGQKNKNTFKKLKIYYVNIRGIKSKIKSLQKIIDNEKPHIICINETKLEKNEKIELRGYKTFYNNNKNGKGGTLIAVRGKLDKIAIETDKEIKEYESLWIKIDNGKNKINIGNIYAPQESISKIDVYQRMYSNIKNKINIAKQHNEKVIVVGDFNAKIGKNIVGNTEEITKSGKLLLDMCIENEIVIINKLNKDKNNIWTRIDGKTKSIIDYALVFKENEGFVNDIVIDSKKKITPFRKIKNRNIYSDHCAILININFFGSNVSEKIAKEKGKLIITEKGLKRFETLTSGSKLHSKHNMYQ